MTIVLSIAQARVAGQLLTGFDDREITMYEDGDYLIIDPKMMRIGVDADKRVFYVNKMGVLYEKDPRPQKNIAKPKPKKVEETKAEKKAREKAEKDAKEKADKEAAEAEAKEKADEEAEAKRIADEEAATAQATAEAPAE